MRWRGFFGCVFGKVLCRSEGVGLVGEGVDPAVDAIEVVVGEVPCGVELVLSARKHAAGNTVGKSDLRSFAGVLDTAGTTEGVFVATVGFTRAAKDYVARSPKRIVLIDGEELARPHGRARYRRARPR